MIYFVCILCLVNLALLIGVSATLVKLVQNNKPVDRTEYLEGSKDAFNHVIVCLGRYKDIVPDWIPEWISHLSKKFAQDVKKEEEIPFQHPDYSDHVGETTSKND